MILVCYCSLVYARKFVGEAMSVIAANTNVPVTVKCRIGVDDHDSYNELCKRFPLCIIFLFKLSIFGLVEFSSLAPIQFLLLVCVLAS